MILEPYALIGHPLSLLPIRCWSSLVCVGCPSPELGPHWTTIHVEPLLCIGRYEGTAKFLGRSDSTEQSLPSSSSRRANRKKYVVQPRGGTPYGDEDSTRCQGLTTLILNQSGKKAKKSALRGSVSLDNRGPHKCSAESRLQRYDGDGPANQGGVLRCARFRPRLCGKRLVV